ncbi:MAG TPA: hypothetical protein VFQ91_15115 [Bryobacteraceae bacterium]|nr:hypothetical protein [Bryobacteraceae bacterium]
MPQLARWFWFVFTLELIGVGWLVTRAVPAMGRKYDADAPLLLALAGAMALLLILDAVVFYYNKDRTTRGLALAVLLVAAVLPAAYALR